METYTTANSDLPDNLINSLCLLPDNTLVIGTVGVAFMNLQDRKIRKMPSAAGDRNDFGVNQVFGDSRGLVWIATLEGLKMYDPKSQVLKEFSDITREEGEMISGIAEDHRHNLWISSTRRMVHINVLQQGEEGYSFEPHVYGNADGLQNCDFNLRSIKTLKNGTIVAGGLYGLNIFNPSEISYNKQLPNVLFSGLSLFDKEVEVGKTYDGNLILPEDLNKVRKVELDYRQNIFSIELATDNFILPEKTFFRYKLEGIGNDWLSLPPGIHRLVFTNLNHGVYTLKVKAVNSDGYESCRGGLTCFI